MYNILCFGDSNTWGYAPMENRRYTELERWTGLMAAALGDEFHVIEEGLNGRTTAFTDYLEPYRNGLDTIAPCILSRFYYPVNRYPMPPVLLAAPGPLDPAKEEYCFDASSARKIKELPPRYEALAKELDCLFFDAQTVLTGDDLVRDGIHLKKEGHAKLARAFTGIIKEYFYKS